MLWRKATLSKNQAREAAVEYRPWTWEVPENSRSMKQTLTRQDAFERVSGQAVFTRDVILPGMLYGKILLSPYAHAQNRKN